MAQFHRIFRTARLPATSVSFHLPDPRPMIQSSLGLRSGQVSGQLLDLLLLRLLGRIGDHHVRLPELRRDRRVPIHHGCFRGFHRSFHARRRRHVVDPS